MPSARLAPGERVLAAETTDTGVELVATNFGLWEVGEAGSAARRHWDEIDRATWTEGTLTVERLVGARETARYRLTRPGRLPMVVRDRVTSSIVVSERVAIPGGHVRVLARRRPGVDGLHWALLYDPGGLVTDPVAREAAQELLARFKSHAGARQLSGNESG